LFWDTNALLKTPTGESAAALLTRIDIFHGYIPVFIIAFLVTLLATPVMRRLAVANGVIDRPSDPRKVHRMPIAYLGGVAVFLGLLGGIFYSYIGIRFPGFLEVGHVAEQHKGESGFAHGVPFSILLGLTIIMVTGLIDDVVGISPRVKIGGQLIAAAALAVERVGVNLAAGALLPLAKSFGIPTQFYHGFETILFNLPLPSWMGGMVVPIDFIYWIGTGIIAIAVLGLCNASNLIDGLDGLNTGVTAIAVGGLTVLALGLALAQDGPLDSPRLVLCLALLGACMGFLPHNFNPATIFLGDAGSLLTGFATCVIILSLGDTGKTQLVAAGLMIYAVPIIDTSLAIVRRKMSGKPISAADDQHLHHMLKRNLGVKGAVMVLYGMGISFAALGVLVSLIRARSVYVIALILAAYIGVIAIKVARKKHIEEQAAAYDAKSKPVEAPAAAEAPSADAPAVATAHPTEPVPTKSVASSTATAVAGR
jgi:UDP-GlcNAc:undecaprenyl-phosphate/decaprenyl-phosphate GlcNAc-1-phosphate transferase